MDGADIAAGMTTGAADPRFPKLLLADKNPHGPK
jgi:hypothetical protein